MPILKIKNLSKSFVTKTHNFEVLKNINITAKEGEFICIVGPSGCGKTILLHIIAGFLSHTSGKILIEGKENHDPSPNKIMVFQDYVLFPWKTVYENIIFSLYKSKLNKNRKKELADYYLDLIALKKFKDWPIYKLSGGMQQRAAIARALIANPKILLMDEPFASLDSQNRKHLRKNLLKIWQKNKKTIIFVTHSINEAIYLADKIYVLTARPTKVKKVYQVAIQHPRDSSSKEFIDLSRNIESHLAKEFEKTMKQNSDEAILNKLLKEEENYL